MNARQDLANAGNLPMIPPNYVPESFETFDQEGLLLSHTPLGIVGCDRPADHKALYLAMYVDGEIAFFSEGSNVLLDRGMENIQLQTPALIEDCREDLAEKGIVLDLGLP